MLLWLLPRRVRRALDLGMAVVRRRASSSTPEDRAERGRRPALASSRSAASSCSPTSARSRSRSPPSRPSTSACCSGCCWAGCSRWRWTAPRVRVPRTSRRSIQLGRVLITRGLLLRDDFDAPADQGRVSLHYPLCRIFQAGEGRPAAGARHQRHHRRPDRRRVRYSIDRHEADRARGSCCRSCRPSPTAPTS